MGTFCILYGDWRRRLWYPRPQYFRFMAGKILCIIVLWFIKSNKEPLWLELFHGVN
jgi:hypothetical protein